MNEIQIKRQIQIMRGIAILMVVMHHTINNLPDNLGGGYLLILFNSDVTIFMVISGYLFEKNIIRYKADKKRFVIRKAKQLMIPYIFWSFILYIGAKVVHDLIGGGLSSFLLQLGFTRLTWWQIAYNIVTFQNSYDEHIWFIYVLFLYFVVAVICPDKFQSKWTVILLLLMTALSGYYLTVPTLLWKFIKHLGDFMLGCVLYKEIETWKSEDYDLKKVVMCAAVVFSISYIAMAVVIPLLEENVWTAILRTYVNRTMMYSVVVINWFWAGFIAVSGTGCSRVINLIGDYSYDIYLMHMPYVVPVAARAIYRISSSWLISFIFSVVLGIIVPLILSETVIRKSKPLRLVMLGAG